MERGPLTDKQQRILTFLADESRAGRRPPTIREIGKRFRLSSSCTVYRHLQALEKKGYLTMGGAHRGIELARDLREEQHLPLVGRVAAGVPTLAEESVEDRVDLNAMFPRKAGTFLLRVKGDSMLNAGIHDGDLVVVERQETAREGEIVVALVEGEATVKRFSRKGGSPALLPENPDFEPIPLAEAESAAIVGRVTGVVRKL